MNAEQEFDEWHTRFGPTFAAYEARLRRKNGWFGDEPLPSSHFDNYFYRRNEASIKVWHLLCWSSCLMGNAILATAAVRLLRQSATRAINAVEKRLWRLHREIGGPICADVRVDTRNAAERERRKVRRRFTLSPMPTAEEFRAAWQNADRSCRDIVAFGALVHDLECYVDNSLAFDENGNIVGRESGILGWVTDYVHELADHYKTFMRYKAIAIRCRQYLKLQDPTPLDPDAPELLRLFQDCPATQKDLFERLDAVLDQ